MIIITGLKGLRKRNNLSAEDADRIFQAQNNSKDI